MFTAPLQDHPKHPGQPQPGGGAPATDPQGAQQSPASVLTPQDLAILKQGLAQTPEMVAVLAKLAPELAPVLAQIAGDPTAGADGAQPQVPGSAQPGMPRSTTQLGRM